MKEGTIDDFKNDTINRIREDNSQEAFVADDIGTASADEHKHHHHMGASMVILAALPAVVAIAASTASVAAAAETELCTEVETARSAAVAAFFVVEIKLVTVSYGFVTAWNLVSEIAAAKLAVAAHLPVLYPVVVSSAPENNYLDLE